MVKVISGATIIVGTGADPLENRSSYIWHPRLFDRGNRESWEMAGSHDLGARLNQKRFSINGEEALCRIL